MNFIGKNFWMKNTATCGWQDMLDFEVPSLNFNLNFIARLDWNFN